MESSCLRLHLQPHHLLSPTTTTTTIALRLNYLHPSPSTPSLLRLSSSSSSSRNPSQHLLLLPLRCSPDSRVEVSSDSDLAPIPPSQRTLTALDMASLWVGMVVGVPSYYLAGSLVDLGMSWWQGVATVVAANLIVLVPLVLTAVPGAALGVPFPVLARAAFGLRGAHVPALLRALVGCGWFGIESWIGGRAVFLLLPPSLKSSPAALAPVSWLGTSPLQFSCFLLFWLAQLAVVLRGMRGIRELEKYIPPRLTRSQFWAVFFPSLTANVSFWATVALNIPDFSRFARSQADQIVGQAGLPVFMGLFTFAGLAITSSTEVIFGRVISDPIQLLGRIGGGLPTTLVAIFGISLATITTNIAANVVAPANALVNLSPRRFTFARGALVTALLGIAFQPWRLLSSSESFVYTWLLGYSALMGPIGGIILADYYLVKRMDLDVAALYSQNPRGPYYYWNGFNAAALAALVAGILPIVPGFLCNVGILSNTRHAFVVAYNNAWFVSFFVSGVAYWLLSLRRGRGSGDKHQSA
ncbi:purine-uracil permease NCS1-like [Ananas comosus]|uniref:Purine-uracil permease NCS1-like n=1 Tax=Ananas comosus TaxID=4615 RepID=A0A6P5EVU3_ANACO|nr:purine-uracil permease NCS1-like [Ananas comosus]